MSVNREIFLRHLGLPSKNPLGIEISRAEGIYLFDTEGKEYIDLVSGVAVSNVGHRHSAVIDAIGEQLKKHLHLMVYGEIIQEPQSKLAKLLTDHLPANLDAVYFVNSGSEAIEGAMKLAKRFTGRTEIIAFKNAYHGGTQGALSILGNEKLKNAYRPLIPGIRFIKFNDTGDLDQITDKTACVVAETVQAEAGIIIPENNFLEKLRQRCNETGTLLVVDDIQMGFGRTGYLFSFEKYGFVPDILTLAKSMGGGMPLGAFIASKEIMDSLTFNPELGHITTFGGHPVCCAAGLANLQVILSEHLHHLAEIKGQSFIEELSSERKIKAIRRAGLMIGVEVENDDLMNSLMDAFLSNGIITDRFLFKTNAFRIAPPLTINDNEIGKVIELLKLSFKRL